MGNFKEGATVGIIAIFVAVALIGVMVNI